MDLLDQLPVHPLTSSVPSLDDTRKAIQHLRNNAPGESGLSAQMFKSIVRDNQLLEYLHKIITDIWNSNSHPQEWDTGRLVILPKKGNLHLPGNYRGIMVVRSCLQNYRHHNSQTFTTTDRKSRPKQNSSRSMS